MAGFATGFHTGASVVERGQRAAREQQEHELQQQIRAMQLANAQLDLDSRSRLADDEAAIRKAASPVIPMAGQALSIAGGGQQFFADPKAANMAADQERTIAEMQATARPGEQLAQVTPTPAWAAGGQVFGDQGQALAAADQANSLNARRERIADTLLGQGRVTEATQLIEAVSKSREEGVLKMLDVIAAGGDGNAAKEAFNRMGTERMGPNDEVRVLRRYNLERPGYAPIPTAEVQIIRNGQVVQHIPDVVSMRHLADKQLDMAKQGYQAGRDEKEDARKDAESKSLVEYRQAGARAADARAAALANAGAADAGAADAGGLTLSDVDKVHKTINDLAKDLFDPKQALDEEGAADIRRQRDVFVERAQDTVRLSFGAGVPITAYEAQIAVGIRDPQRVGRTQDPNTGQWYEVVHVNGRWIPRRTLEAPKQGDAADKGPKPSRGDDAPTPAASEVGDPSKPPPPGTGDLDARAKRLAERRKAQEERDEAERQKREEAKAKRASQVEGLTADRIAVMTPREAASMFKKYRDVLTEEQRRLLNKQM